MTKFLFLSREQGGNDNKHYIKKKVNEVPSASGRQHSSGQHLLVSERLEAGNERISNEAKSPGNAPEGAVITI